MGLNQKEKVFALQRSIETRDPFPLSFIHPKRYTQHNLQVEDGVAAILAVHEMLPVGETRARPVRTFQDGPYAIAHVEYNLWGPKVGFDIHRFEQDLIVEHWDNLQEMPLQANESGRTMLDGPTEVSSLSETASNKAQVERFVRTVLIQGKQHEASQFFQADRLIQHAPTLKDGAPSFLAYVGDKGPARFERLHFVLGEGNFTLTVSEGSLEEMPAAFYNLFRLQGGFIVEHWSVVEKIPDRTLWKNANGKF